MRNPSPSGAVGSSRAVRARKAREWLLVDWLIAGELVPIIVLCIVVTAIMIWAGSSVVATRYIESGAPAWAVEELLLLNLPQPVVIALPMAMLFGAILGFQKLSTDSEAVALLAAGISFWRTLWTAVVIGVVITFIGLWINDSLVPYANARIDDLKAHVLDDPSVTVAAKNAFDLPPIRDHDGDLLAIVHVDGGYDTASRALRAVTIDKYDPQTHRPTFTVWADRARWNGNLSWVLMDVQTIGPNGIVTTSPTLITQDIAAQPDTVAFLNKSPDSLTFRQLTRQIDLLRKAGSGKLGVVLTAEVDLWNKISLPVASIVMALVGSILGFRPQRAANRGTAWAFGIVIILGYYVLFKVMESAGSHGAWDPFSAAFMPDLAGFAVAAILASRVTT